ncbi:hypothetical protein PF010_g30349 [Phytophthora fragariae]|uniref:Aldehyde dehydrogenase domain-containing protein n=1 Tax=Phytophthora fragariae TaxID=53985 RepID=A0A6G0JL07_9STRA|nr:hypothetical protein PF010_g30349 [Phytophthora fragariae]
MLVSLLKEITEDLGRFQTSPERQTRPTTPVLSPRLEVRRNSNGIRTGTVYVNCYDVFDSNTPFGGFKDSGIGRENGELGLRNYLEHKTVIIKRPEDSMP